MKINYICGINIDQQFPLTFFCYFFNSLSKKRQQIFHQTSRHHITEYDIIYTGARGGTVGSDPALQAGKILGSILDYIIGTLHSLTTSGRTMALGTNQALTEMSI